MRENMVKCPGCHNLIEAEAEFCYYCGNALDGLAEASADDGTDREAQDAVSEDYLELAMENARSVEQEETLDELIEQFSIIMTTTPSVEGQTITEYKGVIAREVVSGVNFLKDFALDVRNTFGGRSASYQKELLKARKAASYEMLCEADELGANAIVGIQIGYETLGAKNNVLLVTISGTAVVVE